MVQTRVINHALLKYLETYKGADKIYSQYNSVFVRVGDISLVAASATSHTEADGYIFGIIPASSIESLYDAFGKNSIAIAYDLAQLKAENYGGLENSYVSPHPASLEDMMATFQKFLKIWEKKKEYLDDVYRSAWLDMNRKIAE